MVETRRARNHHLPMPRTTRSLDPESERLLEDEKREKNWKRWGPYLSERQWGTVREDYSRAGEALVAVILPVLITAKILSP